MDQADLDFGIHTEAAPVRAHEWMLRELTRNLLHNAIKHCPEGGTLAMRLVSDGRTAALWLRTASLIRRHPTRQAIRSPRANKSGTARLAEQACSAVHSMVNRAVRKHRRNRPWLNRTPARMR